MRGILLRPKDELAPETSIELALTVPPIPDNVDGPHVARAYEFPDEPHLSGVANLHNGRFAFSSVSGLSRADQHKCVNLVLQAAVLGFHHAASIHYTQGAMRWQGIDHDLKAWRGQFPTEADCSAYATWCLWNGLDHFHHRDTVNGQHWRAGYTGTLLQHGRSVRSPIPGDLVIYGTGWPGEHVAIYTGGGLVVSHGSEAGPLLLPMRYRSDLLSIRRYI